MKKVYLLFIVFLSVSISAKAQCGFAKPEEINQACKVLKSLITLNHENKAYDKVLANYLTYSHINQICQVPQDTKDFMNNYFNVNRKYIEDLQVGINPPIARTVAPPVQKKTPSSQYRSGMPTIRETSN